MLKLLLAIHLVLAVFAIGPLAHAATTAARGLRHGDAAATATSARLLRVYAYVSVLVVIAGFGLLSQKRNGKRLGEFSDTWVWLSLLLWVVAVAIVLALLVPTLQRAGGSAGGQESVGRQTGSQPTGSSLTGRVAAFGGVVALLFAVIVVLMVYRPGG